MKDLKAISADILPEEDRLIAAWWHVAAAGVDLFENGYYSDGWLVTETMKILWSKVTSWYDLENKEQPE